MGRQSVRFAPRPQAQASTICNVTAPVSLSMVLLPQVAAIAHLLAGLCPTSHSRRCGVGAQRPKAAYGHPQKVMRPSRCCREAEGAGQKGGAGVPSDPTRKGHFWRVRGGPPGARDQAPADQKIGLQLLLPFDAVVALLRRQPSLLCSAVRPARPRSARCGAPPGLT